MIPGEYRLASGTITINEGRPTLTLDVLNTGDRPIQAARTSTSPRSTPHCPSTGRPLAASASTFRPNRRRFEPGDSRPVPPGGAGGTRRVFGLAGETNGPVEG